jgi:hypothetical protein
MIAYTKVANTNLLNDVLNIHQFSGELSGYKYDEDRKEADHFHNWPWRPIGL